jgi:uncharacterized membrane-anchored protein YjiN (DUF445 family)
MSSVAVQHPPVPQLSSGDEIQVRHALRRNSPCNGTLGSIRNDVSLRTLIDNFIEGFVSLLMQYRGEIGSLIAEVVRSWDARTVTDRLELVLGSDLQYIRINGTIVGALVGCAIYVLSIDVSRYELWVRDWFR